LHLFEWSLSLDPRWFSVLPEEHGLALEGVGFPCDGPVFV